MGKPIAILLLVTEAAIAELPPLTANDVAPAESKATDDRPWHIDLGFRISYPKLAETKQLLDRRLELPLSTDVFGVFHHPYTPIDRRTDLGLDSFQLGMGRQESDRIVWTAYVGAAGASDGGNQEWLVFDLDVRFRYHLYYTGAVFEFYPWGVPSGIAQGEPRMILQKSRPYLLAGLETGYVSADARGKYRILSRNIYEDAVQIRDWVFSFPIGVGWRIPINDRWSMSLAADCKIHLYRPEEYNGWNFITSLRYRL